MRTVRAYLATLLLRAIGVYFRGRAVTRVRHAEGAPEEMTPGKITGYRVELPGLKLFWYPDNGHMDDLEVLDPGELHVVERSWRFYG